MTRPAKQSTITLQFNGAAKSVSVYNVRITHDLNGPFEIRDTIAVNTLSPDINRVAFEMRSGGETLMNAVIPITVTNTATCITSVLPGARGMRPNGPRVTACQKYTPHVRGTFLRVEHLAGRL